MCDILVMAREDRVLFAKNSDRDPNEAQLLEWHPARRRKPGVPRRRTWISTPAVERTHATLISRPAWMWGAEMGTNEHGVTIGNVAVFTDRPYRERGLTGMDLVRLALERAAGAPEACEVIVELLERHGQGGGCGFEDPDFTYHNSFVVADASGAWLLETADDRWTRSRIEGRFTLSNGLATPDFADRYADRLKTCVSGGPSRRRLTADRLDAMGEDPSPADLADVLRSHGAGRGGPAYSPINGSLGVPCMHGGGILAASQTTASWVSELRPDGVRHWATGTSAPCSSLFKPVSVGNPVSGLGEPGDGVDSSLWWRHERLQRTLAMDPERTLPSFREERRRKQRSWFRDPPPSGEAFEAGERLRKRWLRRLRENPPEDRRPPWVRWYWRERNRRAGLPEPPCRGPGEDAGTTR